MTSIDDKAEAADQPDVDLARQSAPGLYRLESRDLTPADEIGTDEFPQYGDFLPVDTVNGWQYIECPANLAKWLVEEGVETGDAFRIVSVRKVDGEWKYDADSEPDNVPDDW